VADPMLQLEDLHITFGAGTRSEVKALDGVSLQVHQGDFIVVLGTNGSGKSTLLTAIAGATPVQRGRVWLNGRDGTKWPAHRRAGMVGRVFQNPYQGSASGLSVAENLALAAQRGSRNTLARALPRAKKELLRTRLQQLGLGLEHRLDVPMGTLSGGQRQAVTLLMATLGEPSVLLLDEHTAALDPRSEEQVSQLTVELVQRYHLTAIMVTHTMEHAVTLGNRVILMHRGRIVEQYEGTYKRQLREQDLQDQFTEIRNSDLLDDSAADLIRRSYV
jgi:putative tryptophan/tyrosine transport system ATP-binding protein